MKVHKSYYLDGKFDRPDKVTHIVRWANIMEKHEDRTVALVAKRIKSLCLKHYKLIRGSSARFCTKWEEHPEDFMTFILTQFPNGKCKIVRRNKTKDFEPANVDLRPLD